MKHLRKLFLVVLTATVSLAGYAADKDEITLTVTSDGATKDEAIKNALRTAIEQAYGAFVSANTTILNDELVKDEIVTVSNGSIKEYKVLSEYEKADGSGYGVTANATVSLPHLITYAKNHGGECEFAGNTFGMEIKLFNLQKENELKALYNSIPVIVDYAKNNMEHVLVVDDPKIIDCQFKCEINESNEYPKGMGWNGKWKHGYKQASVILHTSRVWFGDSDSDEFEYDGGRISLLFNKPVKRPDGLPSVEKDDEALKLISDIPNGQNALIRFNIAWRPKSDDNARLAFIHNTLKGIGLDYESYHRYQEQGHDVSMMDRIIFDEHYHYDYRDIYLRNDEMTIKIWSDSLMSALNNVKNSFIIKDNNGTISDFAPLDLSEWYDKINYFGGDGWFVYDYDLRNDKKYKASTIKYQYYDPGANSIYDFMSSYSSYIFSFQGMLHRVLYEHERFMNCLGGKGVFDRLFFVDYKGKRKRPYDGKDAYSWQIYVIMPISEIGKYSSFKIEPKE